MSDALAWTRKRIPAARFAVGAMLVAVVTTTGPASAFEPEATYEAEVATLSRAVVETVWEGFHGTGYVNYDNVAGSFVEWTVQEPTARVATLGFHYANAGVTERPLRITVNGVVPPGGDALLFPVTRAWDDWHERTLAVSLGAGVNLVRATATSTAGGPNIDQLTTSPRPDRLLEAETGSVLFNAVTEAVHPGFTGAGYVNYANQAGSWVEWQNVGGTGPTGVSFRYANATGADRPMDISVNGVVVTRLAFPATTGWSDWKTQVATLALATENFYTIRATAVAAGGGPNLDSLTVFGAVHPTTPMKAARADHTATLLATGRVLVVGGNVAGGPTVERYDPATATWSTLAALPTPRSSHQALLLPGGRVMVTGGFAPDGQPRTTVELYNPTTNTWSTAAPPPLQPLGAHSIVLLSSGKVLVVNAATAGQVYDPATNTWSLTGPKRTKAWATLTVMPGGRALAVGGDEVPTVLEVSAGFSRAELYNPANNQWNAIAPAPLIAPREAARSGARTLVLGNSMEAPDCESDDCDSFRRIRFYDPATGQWGSGFTATSYALGDATLTPLGNGDVVVLGLQVCGCLGGFFVAPVAEVVHTDGSRADIAGFFEERTGHAATRLNDGRVLVTGGRFDQVRAQVDLVTP